MSQPGATQQNASQQSLFAPQESATEQNDSGQASSVGESPAGESTLRPQPPRHESARSSASQQAASQQAASQQAASQQAASQQSGAQPTTRKPLSTQNVEATCARKPVRVWPEGDKPGEKVYLRGIDALSNTELLSTFIPAPTMIGEEFMSKVDLARMLLIELGTLEAVLTADPAKLASFPGIDEGTAASIASAGVLTRRLEAERAGGRIKPRINGSEDIHRVYGPEMRALDYEAVKVLCLDSQLHVKAERVLFRGGLTSCEVDCRKVYEYAISNGAVSIAIVHNHPSGSERISKSDRKITKRLAQAGDVLDCQLFDHVVICGQAYVSLASRGLIPGTAASRAGLQRR